MTLPLEHDPASLRDSHIMGGHDVPAPRNQSRSGLELEAQPAQVDDLDARDVGLLRCCEDPRQRVRVRDDVVRLGVADGSAGAAAVPEREVPVREAEARLHPRVTALLAADADARAQAQSYRDDIADIDRRLRDSWNSAPEGRCVDPVASAEKRRRLLEQRNMLAVLLEQAEREEAA